MSETDDNQWPRYQVFHQPGPDRPHVNAGSVHAPDAELALQNARDVFVRRPECSSLWVVPAERIRTMTAEQYQRDGAPRPQAQSDQAECYLLFEKRRQIGSHEYQGEIEARSPEQALEQAAEEDADGEVLVWWVVPKSAISITDPEDELSLFEPARGKDFRGQAAFPTRTMMRKLREEVQQLGGEGESE